jgi:surface antigen
MMMTKKRIAALALLLTIGLLAAVVSGCGGGGNASDPSPTSAAYKGYAAGLCVYYAAMEFDKIAPAPKLNWFGTAYQWADLADNAGWVVVRNVNGINPATNTQANLLGAIVVWTNSEGHVAIVRAVDANGITVQEMNWTGLNQIDSANLTWAQVQNRDIYAFSGYILPVRK